MLLPWGKGSCRAATTGAHMAALYTKGELRSLTHFGSLLLISGSDAKIRTEEWRDW